MHRIRRGFAVAVCSAALLTLPASVLAAGGSSQGATIKITGAHLLANVAVVVDVAVTCQPLDGNSQLSLGQPGNPGLSVGITQRVGKTVASGFGSLTAPVTCDGTTVSHFQVNVLPSGLVPFRRGVAAMDASAFMLDLSAPCCSQTSDSADTGLIAVKVTR